MTCKYARFVVHYKNGDTVVEDKNDFSCWDNLDKNGISAVGIIFDPVPIYDDGDLIKSLKGDYYLRWPSKQHTLYGSSIYNYRFFQYKDASMIAAAGEKSGKRFNFLAFGMVVDPQGHCVWKKAIHDGTTQTYYTSTHSLRLNLELFDINLEECGKEIDN